MAAWLHELWLLKPNCLAPSSKYLSSSINNNDSKMFASEIEMGRKSDGSHMSFLASLTIGIIMAILKWNGTSPVLIITSNKSQSF